MLKNRKRELEEQVDEIKQSLEALKQQAISSASTQVAVTIMERNKAMERIKYELEVCKAKYDEENEMAPFIIFESGQSFGELSML